MNRLPPWSLVQGVLVQLVLPAFGAAALVLAVTCAVTKSAAWRLAGAAVAFIAGLAVGNHFSELLDWWPRRSGLADALGLVPWWALERGWQSLLPVTAVAALAGVPAARLARRGWLWGTALRLIVTAGAAWVLVEALPPLSIDWTFAILFAGMTLNHEALAHSGRRLPGRLVMFAVLFVWGATAATVLIFAHSARFSDLATLMTASVCGAGLIGIVWKVEPCALVAGASVFLPPLMLAGATNTFSDVPLAAFACAAFAPCALLFVHFPPLSRWPARRLTVAAFLVVLIPCAAAIAMSMWKEKLAW